MPTGSEEEPSKLRPVFSRDQLGGPSLETKATIREDPLTRHATVPRGDAARAPTAGRVMIVGPSTGWRRRAVYPDISPQSIQY
jgi:hypothetical protein